MAAHLKLVLSVLAVICLIHSAVSDHHKKKIIIKVPHVIKHIHHNHFKPVHVHKVHAKKVEHHHHKQEEELDWEHAYKGRSGKHRASGSHSHLRPVSVPHEFEEQYHGGGHGQELSYRAAQDYDHSHELDSRHMYGPENEWKSDTRPAKRRAKQQENKSPEARGRWTPIDLSGWLNGATSNGEYSGEDWFISNEDLSDIRGFSSGRGLQNTNNNRGKIKSLNKRTKHIAPEKESDGWKPITDLRGWKDVGSGHHDDQFIHSGEDYSDGSSENNSWEEISHKKKKNKSKKTKWSKQIEVKEPNREEEPQHHSVQQQQHSYQVERPTQLTFKSTPHQVPLQHSQQHSWQSERPPQQKRLPASPQKQHWNEQPSSSLWQPPNLQPRPQPSPTEPSTVVWSGHHLQMPQHSMWHVQQHSVQTVPAGDLPMNPNPLPHLSVPQPLLPLQQHHPPQIQQPSMPVHQVLPPNWPLTQKSPHQNRQVKQHWEQSVHTSGKDGPASSYKVEVINYADQNNRRR